MSEWKYFDGPGKYLPVPYSTNHAGVWGAQSLLMPEISGTAIVHFGEAYRITEQGYVETRRCSPMELYILLSKYNA